MPLLQSSHETRRCRQTPRANRIFSPPPRPKWGLNGVSPRGFTLRL
jgi:hypothetical protein